MSLSTPTLRPESSAGAAHRPRLTPLVRLPEKGASTTSPAPGPAEATAFEPAFSDEDEEEGQPMVTSAVATAEEGSADLSANAEAASSSASAGDDVAGEFCSVQLLLFLSQAPDSCQCLYVSPARIMPLSPHDHSARIPAT